MQVDDKEKKDDEVIDEEAKVYLFQDNGHLILYQYLVS